LDFRGVFTLPSASGVRWRYRFFSNRPIFVRLHRFVVVGRLLDWLTTSGARLHHYMVVARKVTTSDSGVR
jgi:hypothetical protein